MHLHCGSAHVSLSALAVCCACLLAALSASVRTGPPTVATAGSSEAAASLLTRLHYNPSSHYNQSSQPSIKPTYLPTEDHCFKKRGLQELLALAPCLPPLNSSSPHLRSMHQGLAPPLYPPGDAQPCPLYFLLCVMVFATCVCERVLYYAQL